jgi:hypothetical protein
MSGETESADAEYSHFAFLTLWLCFSIYGAELGGGLWALFIQIVPPLALTAAEGYTLLQNIKNFLVMAYYSCSDIYCFTN